MCVLLFRTIIKQYEIQTVSENNKLSINTNSVETIVENNCL